MTQTNQGGKLIATAFVKAQREFSPVLRTAVNPHFKSKFAKLENCVEAVLGALNNNGIALIQKSYDCDGGIMIETVFLHESGETLETGILRFPIAKNDPQGAMACLTYARRGSLMAACGISPEDDDGNVASNRPETPVKTVIKQPEFNESVAADLVTAIGDCQDLDELEKAFKVAYKYCVNNEMYKSATVKAKDQMKTKLGAK